MKTTIKASAALRGGLALAVLLAASAVTCQAGIKAVDYSTDTTPHFSAGVSEVLRMLDAKIDPGVVKAYINSSSVIYSPSASEIIALKQRGVPDEILTAMLERGAEVRVQALKAMQAAPPPPQNYAPTPSDYAQPTQQAPPADYGYDNGYPTSYATYNYYPYYYPYYNSYSYGWGWPWYASWYWPYYYPYYYHGFHDHFHDGHGHDHGHDFNHFAGHNNFAAGRQPWAPAHTWSGSHAGFASASAHSFPGSHTMMASRAAFSGGFHAAPMGGGFHGAPASGGFHAGGGFHGGGGGFGGGHAMGGGGGRR